MNNVNISFNFQCFNVKFRPVMPVFGDKSSVAVAFLNKWTAGTPLKVIDYNLGRIILKDIYKGEKLCLSCDLVRSTLSMMFGWLYFYEK